MKRLAPTPRLIRLSEAARALGYHVETLRLKVRRGELAAVRGAHGTYYVTRQAMAKIPAPRRSGRRAFTLEDLDWTWVVLAQLADHQGASRYELLLIEQIRRRLAKNQSLDRLLTVQRLRLASLTSAEISELTGLSARHVRRLNRRDLIKALDRVQEEVEHGRPPGLREKNQRLARRIVGDIQRRLEAAGFRYHRRLRQPGDFFVPPRAAPASKAKSLFPEDIRRLRDGGLSERQIVAIRLVGIGEDELHELILNGLPPRRRTRNQMRLGRNRCSSELTDYPEPP